MKNITQISIIGAGNVATHLAKSFFEAGININCICSRRIESATLLGKQVHAPAYSLMRDYKNWSNDDLVIVAVKDDAILKVLESGLLMNASVFHTSGSFDSEKMKSYCENFGSFYPFQTFRKENKMNISEVPFFIESNNDSLTKAAILLAQKLSNKVFELNSEGRRKLHISGVFINNFIYYILDKMKSYCLEHHIDSSSLMPLVHKTIDNALLIKENLQTGPAVRGDLKTIEQHLDILSDNKPLQKLYKTLSTLIIEETNEVNEEKVKL